MRVTNNIILHNTTSNINGNKVNVDKLNGQMTSQKKIQRPSEDPVVAIRALRLRSSLSEIDQYYEKNIPDAESWMDITQTAMLNMKDVIGTIRTQCDYGANDALTTENRKTILEQLERLRNQVYAEGNADYAGRTVFTGYRTNQKLTFMGDEKNTVYDISQKLSYADIEEHRYYGNAVEIPSSKDALQDEIPNPIENSFDRIRLPYDSIDGLFSDPDDPDGSLREKGIIEIPYGVRNADGEWEKIDDMRVTIYATQEEWLEDSGKEEFSVSDGQAVFIRNTGELVLSKDASATLKKEKAELDFQYTKTGFKKGELRPEYYHNCTNKSQDLKEPLKYEKYDDKGKEIYQDINYVVAANQTLTVNTTASDVFDDGLGRDVDELIDVLQKSQAANDKVAELKEMKKMDQYSSKEDQEKLDEWIAAAQKEADYTDDNVQKLYNSYIGHCDQYLAKVNLALTNLGTKGQSLALTKNRMSNQQSTMQELKSQNEDRELSDIILEYTSAYTAYQSSLQAAAKINQTSLLNYL